LTDTEPGAAAPRPVMVLGGRLDPADIPAICERAAELLEGSGQFTLRCDVHRLLPDGVALDALARVALVCRRLGRRLELYRATPRLEELVVLAGLIEVLPCLPDDGPPREAATKRSGLEARWQPEHRKEPGGVKEERDPCDPIS
jgi:hypothetical protein